MQYTDLATITTKPGQMRDCLRTLEADLLPAARKETGFVAYTVAKTGESTAVAFGVWQTHEQAERAMKSLDTWAKKSGDKLIDSGFRSDRAAEHQDWVDTLNQMIHKTEGAR